MNATVLNLHSPVVHIFTVKVQDHLSRADRQRYFHRMQRHMSRSGLIMNYSGGLCLAVKEYGANWRTDRHIFVNWLIDQPESRDLVIACPMLLGQMLGGESDVEADVEADFARLSLAEEKVSHPLISKVLSGLMTRVINRLQIDLGA